jgi:plastocyanin
MRRRTFIATLGAGAGVALAGCGTTLSQADYDVGMTANRYRPQRITVAVGETVTWGNPSSRGHSVTAYEDGLPAGAAFFASGDLDTEAEARDRYPRAGNIQSGETYSHTFETAGEYPYFCIPHERDGMVGTVIVE